MKNKNQEQKEGKDKGPGLMERLRSKIVKGGAGLLLLISSALPSSSSNAQLLSNHSSVYIGNNYRTQPTEVTWNNQGYIYNGANSQVRIINQGFSFRGPNNWTEYINNLTQILTNDWGLSSHIQNMSSNRGGFSHSDLGFYINDRNGNNLFIGINTDIINLNGRNSSQFGFTISIGNNNYLVLPANMFPYIMPSIPVRYRHRFNPGLLPQYVVPLPAWR